MSLSLGDVAFLSSDQGRALLSIYADIDTAPDNVLPLLTELRKSMTREQAAALLTTLQLRAKAARKFPDHAHLMLFTNESLQQASNPLIRKYRAAQLGSDSLLDVCCSIGSDSLSFAAAGRRVLGLDIDPVRIAIARHNAAVTGLPAEFEIADVTRGLPDGFDGIFFDPARRDSHERRIHDVERYQPPLSLIRNWKAQEIVVKLSPAVQRRQLASYGGQLEFISVAGELTETLLWRRRQSSRPLATLITAESIHHLSHDGMENVAVSSPKAWLFEPDPAIIRSGALRHLAAQLDATLLDHTIAYLTLDSDSATPWGRYWRILDWMPFSLKKLRRYLVERKVTRLTVKKRGFPMSPEEVIAKLRLRTGDESRVLIMTRNRGRPIVIICESP